MSTRLPVAAVLPAATMDHPLLARFPDLPYPRVTLGQWPTPVDELTGVPGRARVFCKRDDLAGTVYGGNKVRKLEFVLAAAEGRALLTIGAVGSHHVLATAVYGRNIGLETHAVLIPQPATEHARRNARITCANATVHPARSYLHVPGALLAGWRAARAATGRPPMWVAPGGSSPLGALGHVGLGLEIAQDVAEGRLPAPDRVYVALGTGGTAAGLWVGLRLGGLRAEVVAVPVVEAVVANGWTTRRLARKVAAMLPERPALDGLRIARGHLGGGYGHPTAEGTEAAAWAAGSGLTLEPTYTAKSCAAMLADLQQRDRDEVVLFVQTVNGHPMGPLLAATSDDLPLTVERLLRDSPA